MGGCQKRVGGCQKRVWGCKKKAGDVKKKRGEVKKKHPPLEFLLLILNKPEKYTGLEMCEDDNVCWPTHIPKDRTNVRLSRDGGHQVTKMNLNEIWQFMEDARVNHWSLVELAKVRERERE